MSQVKIKTFVAALACYPDDIRKMKSYLEDKRLSRSEKIILECLFLMQDSKFDEVIKKMQGLTFQDELVEAYHKFLLGMTYNNKGDPAQAKKYMEGIDSVLESYGLSRSLFMYYYTNYYIHFNLKNRDGMQACFEKLKQFSPSNKTEEINWLLCQFTHFHFHDDFQQASLALNELKKMKSKMAEHQLIGFSILSFEFYIKQGEYAICSSILDDMKSNKKFYYSANFKFMRVLLNYLWNNERIYLYDQDFKDYPLLFHPIKVILHLEAGEHQQAFEHWTKLKAMEPSVYGDNFQYHGGKNIFSLCLDKLKHMGVCQNKISLDPAMGKEHNLIKILVEANAPVKKEEIYELLWGAPAQDKNDYAKLNKMVCKMKEKTGLDIVSRKGCYFIQKDKMKKAS